MTPAAPWFAGFDRAQRVYFEGFTRDPRHLYPHYACQALEIGYFMSADSVKWRRPVLPGDTLHIEAEVIKIRGSIGQTRCRCFVGNEVASEAELKFALVQQ